MVLGVDGGGTKTKAVVVDENGQIIGNGRVDAGSIRSCFLRISCEASLLC